MNKQQKHKVELGLEKALNNASQLFNKERVGLICNQASVDHNFDHAADLFFANDQINLTTLFGPQHGIRGDVQDNMIETGHSIDEITGLPIYSLYSETREPSEEMLQGIDSLVFDLQDVGCRVYTFIYTMANAMIACAKFKKKFYVLDRPNPIGGIKVEGNVLEPGHESFVGQYPIPMRHGLTTGELAKLFNDKFGINCDLTVVSMDGWKREYYYDETDCPWVLPSPNMPTVETAVVFSGTVYFEGTQVSEGRGTTKPFEMIGAPYINSKQLSDVMNQFKLDGVKFRDINFLPTFQKHSNNNCGGVFVHVTDRESFEPVITGIVLVKTIYDLYKDEFKWKVPPYEYVHDRNPFDVISGTLKTREQIETGASIKNIQQSWEKDLIAFSDLRNQVLLY